MGNVNNFSRRKGIFAMPGDVLWDGMGCLSSATGNPRREKLLDRALGNNRLTCQFIMIVPGRGSPLLSLKQCIGIAGNMVILVEKER
jgi:hypothetical protein